MVFRKFVSVYCNIWYIGNYRYKYIYIQVEPGKPGAEVSKKKNYKSKKEFAYRMCTGWPTTAMPKPRFLRALSLGNATTGQYVQLRNVIYKARNSSMQQPGLIHLVNTYRNYHI